MNIAPFDQGVVAKPSKQATRLFKTIPIPRLVQLYENGVLSRSEISLRVLVTLGTVSVAEHYPTLRDDWRDHIANSVQTAPTNDSEWDEFVIVSSNCGPEKSTERFETEARDKVMQYRAGVEAVRDFLDGNT